jgi:hypothetical protein
MFFAAPKSLDETATSSQLWRGIEGARHLVNQAWRCVGPRPQSRTAIFIPMKTRPVKWKREFFLPFSAWRTPFSVNHEPAISWPAISAWRACIRSLYGANIDENLIVHRVPVYLSDALNSPSSWESAEFSL